MDEHQHPHDHPHEHRAEARHVPMQGAVLDIGGEIGAVLVQTGPALAGAEIELYDQGGSYVMHTEVHARTVPAATPGAQQHAGLFPAVRQGTYLLDVRDGSARRPVVVTGGQVATVELLAAAAG